MLPGVGKVDLEPALQKWAGLLCLLKNPKVHKLFCDTLVNANQLVKLGLFNKRRCLD